MDPLLVGIIGIICLIVLLALGVHVAVALGFVGFLGSSVLVGIDSAVWGGVNIFYYKVSSYAFVTIPLFVVMGYLGSEGDLSKNIFSALNHWIGRIKGGIGIATVCSCALFGTICGSSLVTASVFSVICAPEMRRQGYEKNLAYGICASSGLIGMLIPPSVLAVVYGVLSGESVGKLLIAGIYPGILLTIFYSLTIYIIAKIKPQSIQVAAGANVTWREKLKGVANLWPVVVIALIIFGGIFGGVFNPTEAGAVAALVVLVLVISVQRRESWKLIPLAFRDTATTSAMIFLIFGGAAIFSQFLVLTGIATKTAEAILGLHLSKISLLFLISILYLILGCFLDSVSMLSITIPLFNPIIRSMGINPIYYAVIVILSIETGMITPPVGLCVYGSKAVAEPDVTLEDIFKGVLPFFVAALIALIIVIAYPPLCILLPSLM
jgi:C4-dicarboxylate transporter DctM subunit